jgi:hypothetical protein
MLLRWAVSFDTWQSEEDCRLSPLEVWDGPIAVFEAVLPMNEDWIAVAMRPELTTTSEEIGAVARTMLAHQTLLRRVWERREGSSGETEDDPSLSSVAVSTASGLKAGDAPPNPNPGSALIS